ncbi:hypothetical protein ACWD4L_00385 [Streptomyces sp. NPDC002596]|uniref:hypothetical protein n=1 Tax=unclassified Streptomyces TaxID=2593676 RepID=UPI00225B2150|nr:MULTISPECIES: hypothetical protein [unclassified Streptomyces]MCX4534104.1 hypothetical protein [Streptomyces sp. NBC_01669]WSA00526.1 hypothetical protein OHA79_23355 [Streptomyces sp. NBC_00841]
MTTHASMPTRRRTRARPHRPSTLSWAMPVALGVIGGWWATSIVRGGGVLTGTQLALGLITGAVLAALCYGLGRVQKGLPTGTKATAYGVLFGGTVGFLYSLSDKSVLASSVLALVTGAAMWVCAFYAFHVTED